MVDLERHSRHILLPEVGAIGQEKLSKARVLCVGAGGLGCPVIQYLAAAGVGHLTIVDDDLVDISNLQRQILHRTADIGEYKAESAKRFVNDLDPSVSFFWRTLYIFQICLVNGLKMGIFLPENSDSLSHLSK